MLAAPTPLDDEDRLRALCGACLLDSEEERGFDELVQLASMVCGMPIALVSLVDAGRQWFKARVGLDATETPRDISFCGHAICAPDEILAVPNALEDERFRDNPLVTDGPGIRAYYGRPIRGPEGHPFGTLCVIDTAPNELDEEQLMMLDMLARQVEGQIALRDATRAAQAAASARESFLVSMSHEIRTPLNGVLGSLELALDHAASTELVEDLVRARRSGEQLRAMLDTVLDVSKADSGELTMHPAPAALRDLIDGVVDLFTGQAGIRGLELWSEIEAGAPAVISVDAARLSQVLSNLVGNAVKFTDKGSVTISATCRDAGRIEFAVRDTGRGMTRDEVALAFERFGQAEGSLGTGLGIPLAAEIVRLLGGELTVDSAIGRGSEFRFAIDATPANQAPTVTTRASAQLSGKVLLVDDEPTNLLIGRRNLQLLGLDVTASSSGAGALDAAGRHGFDLILLDCLMPTIDGFEVSERIRAGSGPNATAPIIALTASATDEARRRAAEAGMNDVLEKPISRTSLFSEISRWIDTDRAAAS